MSKRHIGRTCFILLFLFALIVGCTSSNPQEELGQKDENHAYQAPLTDLSGAFDIILEKGTQDFFKGYPIDYAFLHWLSVTYGEDVILDMAYAVYEGSIEDDVWYQMTGSSMHVLWLEYCQKMQYATYYLENVHWMKCASEEVVTMDFTGDINLADEWHTMQALVQRENGIYDCIAPEIVEELQNVDLSIINNEFVFTDGGDRQMDKVYTFGAKTEHVAMLEAFGADLANLANNHTYDYRASGLMDTIATLQNAGIETMGAGANLEEAKAIQYYVANGKKIAIVSATEIERYSNYTKEATETEAGVLKTLNPTIFNEVIREADKNSDYVIVNAHWGVEGTYLYNTTQQSYAQGFIEAGADAVLGGHPHRLQGVEFIEGVPVVYSMGNFWFSTGTLYTEIVQLQIDDKGELALRIIPCLQQNLSTRLLTAEEQDAFYKFMADISYGVVIDKEGFVYDTQNGNHAELLDGTNYQSSMNYGSYNGMIDLEGRAIDIVGNLN